MYPAMPGQFFLYKGPWEVGENLIAVYYDFQRACKAAHSHADDEGRERPVPWFLIWVNTDLTPLVHFQFIAGQFMPQIIDPNVPEISGVNGNQPAKRALELT